MKQFFKALFFLFKWALLILISIELLSFAIVSVSNYVLYGHIREGSRAFYDPYTTFRSSEGVRPTLNECSPGANRHFVIWIFGGSTTRGNTEDDAMTLPSQLAAQLNSRNDGVCYEVRNFGENSYNSLLEIQYFEKQLIHNGERPDLVIFYDGANDCVYFAQHRTPDGHHGYRRAKALVESYYKSFFGVFKALNAAIQASFTKELMDKFFQVQVPIDPESKELKEHVKQVGERYAFANKVAACYGARFLVFWQPAQWVEQEDVMVEVREKENKHFINTERFSTMRGNFTTVYEALEASLKNRSYFIDFRNVLTKRKDVAYKADGVHLQDLGRNMVADAMAEVLEERGILPR